MAASEKPRLPRSDIPPDFKCPYPDCEFQGKIELMYRGHMSSAHGILYERKDTVNAIKTALAKYEKTKAELEQFEEISQLASWHCALLAQHVVTGMPLGPMAEAIKHKAETINSVARSPAAKKYMEKIHANLHDPAQTVKDLLSAGMVNKYIGWEQAFQWAVEAKDYIAVHKMTKEVGLHELLGDQNKQSGPTKIVLNMNMGDLGATQIPTRFQMMEAEIVEAGDVQQD